MQSNFPKSPLPFSLIPKHQHQAFCKIVSCSNNSSSSSSENKNGFKLLGQSVGDIKWRINEFDGSSVQDALNTWVSKTTNFLGEVTSPLVKNVQDKNHTKMGDAYETSDMDEFFIAEQTIDRRTPNGDLSLAAIVSIEQFSRMNGLTGKKMQKIFKALVPEYVSNDARNLVEYCCFRFLSRDSSEMHPCLKEPAFQRLIFVTMLAWEHPYTNKKESWDNMGEKASFQTKLVGKEAFIRIAPAISGLADWTTVHNLFKALAAGEKSISFPVWSKYISELVKVYEGRKSYLSKGTPQISAERILCLGSSRKRPVLKWENNIAWPGKLTLTEKSLYYEAIGLKGQEEVIRMDLTKLGSRVEKTRVGPFGSDLFDSAVSVTSDPESKPWVLEFVDFGGEMRRDVWYAFIKEVISLHQFIRDFGPKENDRSIKHIFGAQKGNAKATAYAINGIARLQALQFSRKLLDEPSKLVPFSYLQSAPYGEIVSQTMAVNCWGGPLTKKLTEIEADCKPGQGMLSSNEVSEVYDHHVYDIDGGIYLQKWKRHPSWTSSASFSFWKNNSVKQALVLNKNLVVSDKTLVEKASTICRDKYSEVEKTQATIDAAMIEGIPSNIDLFKAIGLKGQEEVIRMDLTKLGSRVEKTRVGPFGSDLFDSAVSVTSDPESKPWVLEFVDFGGEMRRDVWYAFIKEVISLHQFIRDFGPKENDRSIKHIFGAQKGNAKATAYAINGIARLQALQFSRKLLDEPSKLVPFSYLQSAPYGEIVSQTMAVNCWGGPLTKKLTEIEADCKPGQGMLSSNEVSEVYDHHVYDIDGGIYLQKWKRHPSWTSSASFSFWKNNSVKQALVLNKNLVVSDKTLVEKASTICRDKYSEVEKTQATIDAAMIEGIPSNIDLFKELVLPLTVIAKNFGKLRRWEEPHLTASFLAFVYALIFRKLLFYVFPVMLTVLATSMLVLKGLKEQGRLGRTFGKVTIRDQPPSNTIEKIIAVKEAMRDVEKYMQNINVSLLKIRTILLAGQPQITTEVAIVLLFGSAVLFTVPFKYVLSLLVLDLFTQELKFRKEMVVKFISFLKSRWDTVPAAPVSVLPFDSNSTSDAKKKEKEDLPKLERTRNNK